jgi:hypothetical protein
VCEREIEEGFLTAFGMTWMDCRSFLSKKNDKPIRTRVLCISALTAPNTKENYVNNLSELLNYFNELLEQTGKAQELTVSAAKLCDLLVEVELMLKIIRHPRT